MQWSCLTPFQVMQSQIIIWLSPWATSFFMYWGLRASSVCLWHHTTPSDSTRLNFNSSEKIVRFHTFISQSRCLFSHTCHFWTAFFEKRGFLQHLQLGRLASKSHWQTTTGLTLRKSFRWTLVASNVKFEVMAHAAQWTSCLSSLHGWLGLGCF